MKEYLHKEIEYYKDDLSIIDENEKFIAIKRKGVQLYISPTQRSYSPTNYKVFRKKDKLIMFEKASGRLTKEDIHYIKYNFNLKLNN